MTNTPRLAALTCVALLAAAPVARADEKADALLKEVAAATQAAKTLIADIEMSAQIQGKTIKGTGTVTLQKPNFARLVLAGDVAQTVASDGKTIWLVNGGQYRKVEAKPEGENIQASWALPVSYFFVPMTAVFFDPNSPGETRYVGTETISGKTFSVVSITGDKPTPYTLTMYIGPDKLFHRMAAEVKQKGGETRKFQAALKNVQTGTRVPVSTFAYTPPKNAREATGP
uniref:Outer membrane lipoprotein carrier protein LolA n=1 Tax=uncultured Armatimonadetes bacterium TaxID=157466 RepID=A0A6J4H492_9BACT|nr:hypothetical protein AVDCRST_MAG63-28 [uncultured Armatimonadetes bacterium]